MIFRLIVAICVMFTALAAQSPIPVGTAVPYNLASGPLSSHGEDTAPVWTQMVSVPGVQCIQIRFSAAELGSDDDAIIITNHADGEVQRLDRTRLKEWQNHSAWFNGSELEISVQLSPDSTGLVTIDRTYVQMPLVLGGRSSICGSGDERAPSNDVRVCRLVQSSSAGCGGCTGWLISSTNTILGAGHCANPAPDYFVVAEFNTPSSSGGCMIHPSVANQFPVDQTTLQRSDGGVGNDWAVARLHPNSSGQTAVARQGSWFTLATSLPIYVPPFVTPTFRVTGHGYDTQSTRSYDQQTDIGSAAGYPTNTIRHTVDTEGGNSGSPIIDEGTGRAIGIHTHGGCDSQNYNSGTSILRASLQTAINAVRGCTSITLTNNSPRTITCTDTIFSYTPTSSRWNGIAISSSSDWDIAVETTPGSSTLANSAFGSNVCDFVIANDHLGNIAPTSGRLRRFSGTASATAEAVAAIPITVGTPHQTTWSSTGVIQMYEYNVTSSGLYDITVTGDNALGWRLYSGGTIGPINTPWRTRSSTTVSTGTVGGSTASNISLSPGWHVIVVTRNGGAAAASPSDLTVTVCNATTSLTLGTTPSIITSGCQDFTVSPTASRWNIAGISGPDSWQVNLGTAHSNVSGNSCNFALANGRNGVITPTWGQFVRTSGTGSATATRKVATSLSVGASSISNIPAGDILRLFEFNITSAGTYDISVSGGVGESLFWRAFAPQSSAEWIDRANTLTAGSVGASGAVSVALSPGYHALVVYKNGGPVGASTAFTARVCASLPVLALGTTATTITTPCRLVDTAPTAGSWTAVAVTSPSDWDIAVGQVRSEAGGGTCDFVLANGNLGTTPATTGVVSRWSGSSNGQASRSLVTNITVGSTYGAAWGSTRIIRLFQVQITSAGSYNIALTGASGFTGPRWYLFNPGTGAGWRARGDYDAFGSIDGTVTTRNLGTGWHCLAVVVDGGTGASGTINILVTPTPNPLPGSLTLSPSSAVAGSPAINMDVNGSGFIATSVVRWNGANLSTTYISSTSLRASVSAARLTTPGTASVTVFSPAPGGGTSPSRTFTIENPVPTITSLNPNHRTAGTSAFTLNVNGTGFNTNSVVLWTGVAVPTTYVSPTSVQASISAAQIASPGSAFVRVRNPAPGGGLTPALTFTIDNPAPTLTSLNPSSAFAGSPAFTMNVNGSNFVNASVVRWNGSAIPTSFVSATQLQATVATSLLGATGTANVDVRTPPPGGGTSTSLTFTILAPTLSSVTPSSIAIMGPASPPAALNLSGSGFHAGSVVYANSDPLPTVFVNSTTLQAALPPSVLQTQTRGGIAITVQNVTFSISNTRVVVVGGAGNNQGTLIRFPLNPVPGQNYSAVFAGGAPGGLLTAIIDATNPAPIYPWPSAAENFVLSVRPLPPGSPDWLPLVDGIGLYGPAQGVAFNGAGRFVLPGFVRPNPAIGIDLTVQGVFLDGASPVGYRLMWARYPDEL